MSGKNRNCRSCSDKKSDDCDTCNDKKKLIPVYGPPGPPGPPGPSVGTIIPYGSGSRFEIPASVPFAATLGFGNHHIFSSENEAISNSEDTFIVPRDGKIKSLFFGVSSSEPVTAGFNLEVWKSESDDSGVFTKLGLDIGFADPNLTYRQDGVIFGDQYPISQGTSLMMVITILELGGIKNQKFGFRAGLNIE